jgi:hypothetical protein
MTYEPSAERAAHAGKPSPAGIAMPDGGDYSAVGLTAVWATENSRGALFDAMKARETFATSGPRIKVRLFGRLGSSKPTTDPRVLVERAYAQGVPRGGTLKGDGSAPSFAVWAMKDPDGANLDRIQIVKGWVDASGEPQDKVYDVVWSGDRKPGAEGKIPVVGNTVDLTKATSTNSIGSPALMGSWSDPDFDHWGRSTNPVAPIACRCTLHLTW